MFLESPQRTEVAWGFFFLYLYGNFDVYWSGWGRAALGKIPSTYLERRYGVISLRFSDPIKELLRFFFDQPSREDQSWVESTFKERFGKDIFIRAVDRRLLDTGSGIFSINGICYPEDADFARPFSKNIMIYVTADQHLRWERSQHREEKSDDAMNFETFCRLESTLETEKYIGEIGKHADYAIYNKGTTDKLFASVDRIMGKCIFID